MGDSVLRQLGEAGRGVMVVNLPEERDLLGGAEGAGGEGADPMAAFNVALQRTMSEMKVRNDIHKILFNELVRCAQILGIILVKDETGLGRN